MWSQVGHHAALAIHRGTGYGVVILLAGHFADAARLAYDAFAMMQLGVDRALADLAAALYTCEWRADRRR